MRTPTHLGTRYSCPKCHFDLEIPERVPVEWFTGAQPVCPRCNQPLDWWEVTLNATRDGFSFFQFAPVGAKSTLVTFSLEPGKRLVLKLADFGIPSNARILKVNYTPQDPGGLFPNELHGNSPERLIEPHERVVYPIPFVDDPKPTLVGMMVTWVASGGDEVLELLIEAFHHFAAHRFGSAIIPANTAAEVTVGRLIAEIIGNHVGKKRLESFLRDAATYSHQLNVLLPLVTGLTRAPPLPEHIRGLLNRLRELRNELAHTGAMDPEPTREEVAELLCAALYGTYYVRGVHSLLVQGTNAPARPPHEGRDQ